MILASCAWWRRVAKQSPLIDLGKRIQDELSHDVPILAKRLQPEVETVGAEKLSRQEFLALVHRNWSSADFRQGILKSMGPKAFNDLAKEMVQVHGHPQVPGLPAPLIAAPMPIPPNKAPFNPAAPSGEMPSTPMMPSSNVPGG